MKRKILLNPGPATTSERIKSSLVVEDICPRESDFGQIMIEITDGLLEIGYTNRENYSVALFAASGTGAMEATLTSSVPEDGKVLIITNGAYGLRAKQICENYNIPFDSFGSFGEYPNLRELEKLLNNTFFSHLFMVHHETSTGMMNPLDEVVNLCQELNVKTIIDAMSTFGAYPININSSGIDYLISSSNKCIHGIAGLSYVIFKNSNKEELKANSRTFYFDVYRQWKNLVDKSQLRFTPPVQVCYAFLAAIKETLKESVTTRWTRYQNNWQMLYDGMKSLGFTFHLQHKHQSKILLAINIPDNNSFSFNDLHDFLYEYDITIYPGVIPESNTFRMAIIGDLYIEDIQYVLEKMKDYIAVKPIVY